MVSRCLSPARTPNAVVWLVTQTKTCIKEQNECNKVCFVYLWLPSWALLPLRVTLQLAGRPARRLN